MIKIKIEREVDNPEYDAKYDEDFSRRGMGGMYNEKYEDSIKRQKTRVANILDTEITEEQFAAIRKAVLENF